MAVSPCSIVEHLDVFEDVCLGEVACSVDVFSNALLFQATEERFSNGIVPAVTTAAHAGVELVCFAEPDPVIASVLRALVRVHDDSLLRLSSPDCHHERVEHKVTNHCRLHRPADDHAAMKIHDDCQVQPAFPGSDVRNVRDPSSIGSINRELTLEKVGRRH